MSKTDLLEPESMDHLVGSKLRASGGAKVRVEHRPARVAYIIPEGDEVSFRVAVREASSRWLGGTELILPVKAGEHLAPIWNQFLSFADVDALIFVDLPLQEIASDGVGVSLPKVVHEQIDRLAPSKYSYHPSSFDLVPRAEATALELITSSPSWLSAAEDSPIWEVVALGLAQAPAEPSLEHERLSISVRHSSIQAGWAQIDQVSLLHRTLQRTSMTVASPGQYPGSAVIWVCEEEKQLEEALHFWNRRALNWLGHGDIPMFFLPEWLIESWPGLPARVEGVLGSRHDFFDPDVFLIGSHVPKERLEVLAEFLGLVKNSATLRTELKTPLPPLRVAPFTFESEYDPTRHLLFHRRYGLPSAHRVAFFDGGAELEIARLIPRNHFSQCLVSINLHDLRHYPSSDIIANMIVTGGAWRDGAIEFPEPLSFGRAEVEIRLPSMRSATEALLKDSSPISGLSDKATVARALARQTREVPVSEEWVFKLVRLLRTPRSKELERVFSTEATSRSEEDLELLAKFELLTGFQRYHASYTQIRSKDSSIALLHCETLAAEHWLERGLIIKCSECHLESFVRMIDATPEATCPGCGSKQHYKADTQNLEVHYELSSLLQVGYDQGALQQYLACLAIERQSDTASHLIPGVAFESTTGKSHEVDLFGIVNSTVVAGEVKTQVSGFDLATLEVDLRKSQDLGAKWHLAVCFESFSPELREALAQAAEVVGIPAVCVGPDELWRENFSSLGVRATSEKGSTSYATLA